MPNAVSIPVTGFLDKSQAYPMIDVTSGVQSTVAVTSPELMQPSMNVCARRSPYENAASDERKLRSSGKLATGDASGSVEEIDQCTEYRRSLPSIDTTLFAVTWTSMLKPRYDSQDWVCMMVPSPVRLAACGTSSQLTPHSGTGLRNVVTPSFRPSGHRPT